MSIKRRTLEINVGKIINVKVKQEKTMRQEVRLRYFYIKGNQLRFLFMTLIRFTLNHFALD